MLRMIFAASLSLMTTLTALEAQQQKPPGCERATYKCDSPPAQLILVRHGCRLDGTPDSPLTKRGWDQAEDLVVRIGGYDISGIYVTNRPRTRQTACPLANHKKLKPIPYNDDSAGIDALLKDVCSNHSSKTVVYVGHSYTLDDLFCAFGSKDKEPGYSDVWVISFSEGKPSPPEKLPSSQFRCQ